jgi:hypothetical protein
VADGHGMLAVGQVAVHHRTWTGVRPALGAGVFEAGTEGSSRKTVFIRERSSAASGGEHHFNGAGDGRALG